MAAEHEVDARMPMQDPLQWPAQELGVVSVEQDRAFAFDYGPAVVEGEELVGGKPKAG